MVLSSQTPRAGMSRMYMSSKRRSKAKWGWLVLIGIVLVSMWVFVWSDSGGDAQGGDGVVGPNGVQADVNTPKVDPSAKERTLPSSVTELPPPEPTGSTSHTQAAAKPVVQTIGVNETRSAPPVGSASTARPPVTTRRQSPPQFEAESSSTGSAASKLARGMNMIREGRLVQGRRALSEALLASDGSLSALDAQTVRDTLASVNKQLVFSNQVTPADPLAESYLVQSGDYLSVIAPKYGVPYQFLERINQTPAERLQAGKPIKVIKGPFHARISKRNFRMDIFLNDADGTPIYIRSFKVGLGEKSSTPMGPFIIAPGSKVTNPSWRNPRTHEFYAKDNPDNPIGEYWMALKGANEQTESLTGYGIHGTIDPSSIGREASMGCVRMSDDDIALLFDMLSPGQSTVQITW